MAVRDMRSRVSLEGLSGYKQALAEMGQGLSVLNSELKLNTEQFKGNEDSIEALTKRGDTLDRMLLSQKDRVDLLREAYQKSAQQNGESSKTTQDLAIKLNNAEAAMYRMDRALQENTRKLETATKKTDDFGDAQKDATSSGRGLGDMLSEVSGKLGITFPVNANKSIKALNKIDASTITFVGTAAKMISSLVKMSVGAAKTADDILTMSVTTGLSTDQLQEFKYASELIDVSLDTMTGSMSKMINSMNTARSGSKETAEAYRKLGIRITGTNGQLRDANTVYYEAIEKLGRIKNETERDAIAMKIFGESARDLNPLIEAGADRLAELADEAHNVGYVMSEDTLGKLGELDDAMQRFENQSTTLKNTLGLALLPILTDIMQLISAIPPDVIAVVVVVATVATTVIAVVKAVKSVTGVIDVFSGKTAKTTLIVLGVVAALIALAAIIAVIAGKSGDLDRAMNSIGQGVSQVRNGVQNAQRTPGYADGTDFHPGGFAWVGEKGPELVRLPRGSSVIPNERSMAIAGGSVYYVTIDAKSVKEFNDIVRIAQRQRLVTRAGTVKG